MNSLDWVVLILTLAGIIAYGLYKSRTTHNLDGYVLSNRSMGWGLILLSIMGTQASAITFLSAPGQAYTDGMRFVQYYFGLPLAAVVVCIAFVPIFSRLKVYTAYEYLESRFDVKTRALTAFLFLLNRGLSTGISVFAPSIILSSLLGWNLYWTNLFMGGLLIIYTVSGGAKAVAYTQKLQLIIIFIGMFLAAYLVVSMLPKDIGFFDALHVSGKLGKLNVITSGFKNNGTQISKLENSSYKDSFSIAQAQYLLIAKAKTESIAKFSTALANKQKDEINEKSNDLRHLQQSSDSLRGKVKQWIKAAGGDNNDTNYIFLRFVVDYLPAGLVGLLIAIIFLASWGSIAAALHSLSSCTMIDFHKRFSKRSIAPEKEYQWSKRYTLAWGIFCIVVAMFTYNIGNSLIEAVNVLGSLFYGVILGVFLVAFFLKKIRNGFAVFLGALLAECLVLTVFILAKLGFFQLGFLWLNPIGALGVIIFSLIFNLILRRQEKKISFQ